MDRRLTRLAALAMLANTVSCGPSETTPVRRPCAPAAPTPRDRLVVAGSGTGLAPLRAIAQLYAQSPGMAPDTKHSVYVAPSIGTSGAVRALVDGAIDIGLATRSLTHGERTLGLVEIPLARIALAFVVRDDNQVTQLAVAQLADLVRGTQATWPDGSPVIPLVRQPGDSTSRALATGAGLTDAVQHARRARTAQTLYTDREMRDAILRTRGALGVLDTGTIALENLPVRALRVDGREPRASDPRYPYTLTVGLLVKADQSAAQREFIAFCQSPSVTALLRSAGYVPLAPRRGP